MVKCLFVDFNKRKFVSMLSVILMMGKSGGIILRTFIYIYSTKTLYTDQTRFTLRQLQKALKEAESK